MSDKIIREVYDNNLNATLQLRKRENTRSTYISLNTSDSSYIWPENATCFQYPISYHIRVTDKCNLHCPYCYTVDGNKTEDMSDAKVFELLNRCTQEEVMLLTWTGGEPLTRHKIYDFISVAHSYGIHQTLLTNGTLLDNYALSKLPLDNFVIQVGFNEPWGTSQATKENHEIILENLRNANSRGFSVIVTITMAPEHVDKLPSLLEKLQCSSVHNIKIGLLLPMGKLKGMDYTHYIKEIRRISARITKLKKTYSLLNIQFQYDYGKFCDTNLIPKRFLQCEAGVSQIYLDNNGDVYPCPLFKSYPEFNCGNYFNVY